MIKVVSAKQNSKTGFVSLPIRVQLIALKLTVCKLEQSPKAPSQISVTPLGIVIEVIPVPLKALPPINVMLEISIDERLLQFRKVSRSITVTLLGRSIEGILLQLRKAARPMDVTFGIEI